jgi:N-acyl amino acid synthase of PEP-CTERM/exosortase system
MMLSGSKTLTSQFFRQFEISLADTRSLQQRVCQIRHRVYCQELDFEPHSSDGLETDEHDDHSLHVLLRDHINDVDVACIRIVEPLNRGGGLPFEKTGLRYMDRRLLDLKQLEPTQCCEISRLAVLENIRRSSGRGVNASELGGAAVAKDLRVFIPVALSYAGLAVSLACNYKWMFMVAEPRLQRFLIRYGLISRQISPVFDWHGQRALFVFSGDDLLAEMRKWKPQWYEFYNYIEHKVTDKKEEFAIALAS